MHSHAAEHIHTLAGCSLFKGLSATTLTRLTVGITTSNFKRGSVVLGRGSIATGIFVVAAGQLKLSIDTVQGNEHVVELIQEGECFGEAAVLAGRTHLLSAVALTDCTLVHVTRGALLSELELNHQLAQRLISNLSDRLYRRTSDLENILLRKALGRVARFLLDELVRDGRKSQLADGRIELPSRKGLIASRLNMTQEHFSRTLRSLSASGKIEVSGATIDVLNMDGLRQIAA